MVIHRVGSLINRSRNQIVSYFEYDSTHLLFLIMIFVVLNTLLKKMVDLLIKDPLRVPRGFVEAFIRLKNTIGIV